MLPMWSGCRCVRMTWPTSSQPSPMADRPASICGALPATPVSTTAASPLRASTYADTNPRDTRLQVTASRPGVACGGGSVVEVAEAGEVDDFGGVVVEPSSPARAESSSLQAARPPNIATAIVARPISLRNMRLLSARKIAMTTLLSPVRHPNRSSRRGPIMKEHLRDQRAASAAATILVNAERRCSAWGLLRCRVK